MNSFAAGLCRIAEQARSGALGDDGEWLADGIELFIAKAGDKWSLDRALILAWSNERRARRNDELCEHAARYCQGRAAMLAGEITRYERSAWRHDRDRAEMPPSYVGTPRELLFRAFRENDSIEPHRDMPTSVKHLERIISRSAGDEMSGHDPPIPMSKKVPHISCGGGAPDVCEKVQSIGQRRRRGGGR